MQAKNEVFEKALCFSAKLPCEALIDAVVAVWRLQRLSTAANKEQKRIQATLEASRGSVSRYFPHHQSQIERTGMNQQPLDDVFMTPKVCSAHASGFVHVRETAFHRSPRWRNSRFPRSPLIRRRFWYTAAFSSCLPIQFRRPRSGSEQ